LRSRLSRQTWIKRLRFFVVRLVNHPAFWMLTVCGNTLIVVGALLFYYLEAGVNPRLVTLLDALFWAVSMVTTVGSDTFPVTDAGKTLSICVMVLGTAMFWSYMALFAEALLVGDISDIDVELSRIERIVKLIEGNKELKDQRLKNLLEELRLHLKALSRSERI
jgi:hypothetical protein